MPETGGRGGPTRTDSHRLAAFPSDGLSPVSTASSLYCGTFLDARYMHNIHTHSNGKSFYITLSMPAVWKLVITSSQSHFLACSSSPPGSDRSLPSQIKTAALPYSVFTFLLFDFVFFISRLNQGFR